MEILKDNWLKIPLVLYVMGFTVHNVYLSQFGNYEFELIQAKYILSGFGFIGFVLVCLAYYTIKVNLSDISSTLFSEKLWPWLLRVVSFPYVVYEMLYGEGIFKLNQPLDPLNSIINIFFLLAKFIVYFSIFDIVFMYSSGDGRAAKIVRSFFRVMAIPMILVTCFIALNESQFAGVFRSTSFLLFGFVGIAISQNDKKYGINPNYLDPGSDRKHEDFYVIFIGIIAIFFLCWFVVSNYTKYIYPNIPVALGGAKIVPVNLYIKDRIIDSDLIQESDKWILIKSRESGEIEKIKTDLVNKIIYKKK